MNRNPITPYILIMLIGIVAVFFISMKGLGDKHQLAVERGDIEEDVAAEFDPEVQSKSCISCHGDNLEGGSGPALVGTDLEVDEIADIIINGKGSSMPAGLVPTEHVTEFAEWLKSLE